MFRSLLLVVVVATATALQLHGRSMLRRGVALQMGPKKFDFDPAVGIEVVPRRFKKSTKQLSTLGK